MNNLFCKKCGNGLRINEEEEALYTYCQKCNEHIKIDDEVKILSIMKKTQEKGFEPDYNNLPSIPINARIKMKCPNEKCPSRKNKDKETTLICTGFVSNLRLKYYCPACESIISPKEN